MIDEVIEKCKLLRLKACADNLQNIIEMAAQKNWPSLKIVDHLLALELEARRQSKIILRFKQSKLLEKPTIDQFDFNFHISRKKQKGEILQLLNLDFIDHKKDIMDFPRKSRHRQAQSFTF
jgi:DNA replication protein DnaC